MFFKKKKDNDKSNGNGSGKSNGNGSKENKKDQIQHKVEELYKNLQQISEEVIEIAKDYNRAEK